MTKKDNPYYWSAECQAAFKGFKARVTSAPILAHFDPTKEAILKTDSSDYVTGGILSQYGDDGLLHPVAFYSHKMLDAECNYEIYDKELLAIVKCFENWRPELEFSDLPIQVFTDHRGLEYFYSKKTLTRRQARWAEKLFEFKFKVHYRDGKSNQKADALTRASDSAPKDPEESRRKHQQQILLGPERLAVNVTDEQNEVQPEQPDIQSESGPEDDRTIYNQLAAATATDEMASVIIEAIRDNAPTVRTELGKLSLTDSSIKPYTITEAPEVEARLILIRGQIWVPTSCVVDIIREVHAQKATGHPGRRKTAALLRRYFVWQSMTKDIHRYIDNCHACRRSKAPRHKLYGELQPLPVP